MAQQLREYTALARDWSSVRSTDVGGFITACVVSPALGDLTPSFGSHRYYT